MSKLHLAIAAVAAALAAAPPARAQSPEITVGISVSTTGPAAALGVPERNALEFVPKEIGGVPLK
ncbi:MAG: branched-chain amino acid ABC transporter substrate-binding protein, partial [Tardiphaga sp.]